MLEFWFLSFQGDPFVSLAGGTYPDISKSVFTHSSHSPVKLHVLHKVVRILTNFPGVARSMGFRTTLANVTPIVFLARSVHVSQCCAPLS